MPVCRREKRTTAAGTYQKGSRSKYRRYPKPPYSYTGMIIAAIWYSPCKALTLAQIREEMETMFPFFRQGYEGWKDSVRHNLSRYDCFSKLLKNPSYPDAKGNFWIVFPDKVPLDAFDHQNTKQARLEGYSDNLLTHLGLPPFPFPVNSSTDHYATAPVTQTPTNCSTVVHDGYRALDVDAKPIQQYTTAKPEMTTLLHGHSNRHMNFFQNSTLSRADPVYRPAFFGFTRESNMTEARASDLLDASLIFAMQKKLQQNELTGSHPSNTPQLAEYCGSLPTDDFAPYSTAPTRYTDAGYTERVHNSSSNMHHDFSSRQTDMTLTTADDGYDQLLEILNDNILKEINSRWSSDPNDTSCNGGHPISSSNHGRSVLPSNDLGITLDCNCGTSNSDEFSNQGCFISTGIECNLASPSNDRSQTSPSNYGSLSSPSDRCSLTSDCKYSNHTPASNYGSLTPSSNHGSLRSSGSPTGSSSDAGSYIPSTSPSNPRNTLPDTINNYALQSVYGSFTPSSQYHHGNHSHVTDNLSNPTFPRTTGHALQMPSSFSGKPENFLQGAQYSTQPNQALSHGHQRQRADVDLTDRDYMRALYMTGPSYTQQRQFPTAYE